MRKSPPAARAPMGGVGSWPLSLKMGPSIPNFAGGWNTKQEVSAGRGLLLRPLIYLLIYHSMRPIDFVLGAGNGYKQEHEVSILLRHRH